MLSHLSTHLYKYFLEHFDKQKFFSKMSNEPISKDHCGLDYWKEAWVLNDIRFHKEKNHPMLEKHLSKLTNEKSKCKIFFPLCGKAIDMVWLASLGHEIVGVDIAQEAMDQFFAENKIKHTIEDLGDFKLYKSFDSKIRLYVGDLFKLTPKYEGLFECVWDRGGLVALTPALRIQYSAHMQTLLAEKFRYLLDAIEYDQSLFPGPPHCVKLNEITDLYGKKCKIQIVDSVLVNSPTPLAPNLIEDKRPYENVYLLSEI